MTLDLRQDLRSLVNILGAQPEGSTAWKCGNLAQAILDDVSRAQVYVLMSCNDYENSSPVFVYWSEAQAKAALAVIDDYHKTKPRYDGEMDDEVAWTTYDAAEQAWRKGHPAGSGHAGRDGFYITAVPMVSPA